MSCLETTPCPGCGEKKLRIEERLEAKPLGTYSLAGVQMKTVARPWLWLICGACGIEARSK